MVFPEELLVIILSLSPLSECRGALIFAFITSYNNLPRFITLAILSVVSNMIVPFIAIPLLTLIEKRILLYQGNNSLINSLKTAYEHYVKKVRKRSEPYVNKWGFIGLTLFVGIPLPFTGAWTGSLAAHILGISKRKAIIASSLGIVMAAIIIITSLIGGLSIIYLRNFTSIFSTSFIL